MRTVKVYIIFLFILFPFLMSGNNSMHKRSLHWIGVQDINISEYEYIKMLRFKGSTNDYSNGFLPLYFESFELSNSTNSFKAEIFHAVYEALSPSELLADEIQTLNSSEIQINSSLSYDRKKPYGSVSFIPIRKNELTGLYEKLIQFAIVITETSDNTTSINYKSINYKSNSVLADGNWYKIAVNQTGIHKITYQELADMGIPISTINPKNIRIYGFPGGMLPENVAKFRYDDLQQAAIHIEGENDESFDQADYILFYGESPNVLKYSSDDKLLHQHIHLYSDYTYYFITADLGEGKRMQTEQSSSQIPNNLVSKYNDAIHYEVEETNLLNSGRIWYGETFDVYNNMKKDFNIRNLDKTSEINLFVEAAARSQVPSYFSFYVNGNKELQLSIPGVNISNINGDYAAARSASTDFVSTSEDISIEVVYSKPTTGSVGYFDYFTLNFVRDLAFDNIQLPFRSLTTTNSEYITEYTISKVNNDVYVWDVTNPLSAKKQEANLSGTKIKFVRESDSIQEFIAFNNSQFYSTIFVNKIENQNLHGTGDIDMIILSHPNFISEAERLAEFHRDQDDLSVVITTPQEIYNEFSSGAQDITAIRDFMKLLYDNSSPGNELKYLLLFGDGSFDYKDREDNNTNYVPCWESAESLNPVNSYVKDDYFALLDDASDNLVDIGVGRFVVGTLQQAKDMVDKTIIYAENSQMVMGDWRNIVCLVADDEDSNLHFGDAEDLATIIDTMNTTLNIDKIYLDAYPQVSTPSGERYPDVTLDINNRVEKGALIFNYVGHGGEGGLAHERIMTINDINSWDNIENMPVFITATCEFSRFDDPERVSAGEYISLNPNGGGISLFTTTRATYAGANFDLNRNFYRYALKREDGEYLRMGDIIRKAKNASGSVENKSKFMLLGDPALKIAFPEHTVVTSKINDVSVNDLFDSINALSEVNIKGELQDYYGNKLTSFDGTLYPTVFDKPSKSSTLGNDPNSSPATFYIQKNALYKGKATVTNGEWEFSFIAPKDIAYQYGYGKLSYYAKKNQEDAAGYFSEVVIGGYNENAAPDDLGPMVRLFMNDTNFVKGGLTDENPSLFALIFDKSGINTVGNGIGHDILATLDNTETFVLNNYYEAELNDYQSGSILYPFYQMENGPHTLSLKVWDIHNNSSTVTTDFIVSSSIEMALNDLMNYPNPFYNYTTFSFEHNQVEQPLDIMINIYSLDGKLVSTLSDIYYAGGYRYKSIKWDGSDSYGNKLNPGMYVYKLLVRNYDGTVVDKTSKLVIMK